MTRIKQSLKKNIQRAVFGVSIEAQLFRDLVGTRGISSQKSMSDGQNIIITGGELFNKGAQAMTFTVVDQLHRLYPDHTIYLFSTRDFKRPQSEKDNYVFNILPWGIDQSLKVLTGSSTLPVTDEISETVNSTVEEVVSNSAFLVDISGYALSSQWGFKTSFSFLSNLVIMSDKSIPMYIFPQSIGPLEYSTSESFILNPMMNLYLTYPEIICPREQEGVEEITPYTKHNVQHEFDIVLQNKEYDLENIFVDTPDMNEINVEEGSVGIVPNSRVLERIDTELFYDIYGTIIDTALEMGRSVYILRHSTEDLDICQRIKERFQQEERVHLLEDDLYAIELENIIKQFSFMIGSRYHSIIHAYKNSTPVIAIGWATKYRELLSEFDQSQYFFDSRQGIDQEALIHALSTLDSKHSNERVKITQRREEILATNIFDETFNQD